jgi:hypothetical protein
MDSGFGRNQNSSEDASEKVDPAISNIVEDNSSALPSIGKTPADILQDLTQKTSVMCFRERAAKEVDLFVVPVRGVDNEANQLDFINCHSDHQEPRRDGVVFGNPESASVRRESGAFLVRTLTS